MTKIEIGSKWKHKNSNDVYVVMKRYNFFEKIYWGWKQVYYNFDEWCWVVSGKNDEFDAPVTLDLFIGLNINLSQILEES